MKKLSITLLVACFSTFSGCAFAKDVVKGDDAKAVEAAKAADPCEGLKKEYSKLLKAYENAVKGYYKEKQARLRAESAGFAGELAEDSKRLSEFKKVIDKK
jgi:hypothetical protein